MSRYRRSSSASSVPCSESGSRPEGGRPDRLVRLLGALRAGLVDAALAGAVALAEAVADQLLRLGHRDARDRGRVRPHVGDEADVAVGRVDALVQPLGDAHRPLGAEAELAARLLLQRAGGERRRGVALRGPRGHGVDDGLERAERGGVAACACRRRRSSSVLPAIRETSAPNCVPSGVASSASSDQYSRAVNARDLPLALDDQAHGDRLHAARRQAARGPCARSAG